MRGGGLGRWSCNDTIPANHKSYEILRSFPLSQYDNRTNIENENKNVKNLFPYCPFPYSQQQPIDFRIPNCPVDTVTPY